MRNWIDLKSLVVDVKTADGILEVKPFALHYIYFGTGFPQFQGLYHVPLEIGTLYATPSDVHRPFLSEGVNIKRYNGDFRTSPVVAQLKYLQEYPELRYKDIYERLSDYK